MSRKAASRSSSMKRDGGGGLASNTSNLAAGDPGGRNGERGMTMDLIPVHTLEIPEVNGDEEFSEKSSIQSKLSTLYPEI